MESNSHVKYAALRVISHEAAEYGKVRWRAECGRWSATFESDPGSCPPLGARVEVRASYETPVRGTEFYEVPVADEDGSRLLSRRYPSQ